MRSLRNYTKFIMKRKQFLTFQSISTLAKEVKVAMGKALMLDWW
jgi:hypothetical protein